MYEFHFDYIKNTYGNKPRLRLFSDTENLVWLLNLKLKVLTKILVKIKKFLILVNIQLSQDFMMIQTK